ncbi:MAG: VWA domain-containing protein [Salinivirgaceae bacterium]|jgi:Ca-activated chloride channel family protein|nr:VWA domain-containing protein [Salinivirgaceae bacterium]
MFQFANIEYLYALIALPLLGVIFLIALAQRRKAIKEFGDAELVKGLIPEASKVKPWLKFILLEFAMMLIIIGLAGPQFGTKLKEVKREGIELVIALDVSNSMLAEDIAPNRLENSKRAISKLVDRLQNDKIALIIFAGDAFVQLPMTADYTAVKMFLSSITPKLVSNQGTAIGAAIDLGMKSFSPGDDKNKALIIITDGENHEGNALELATTANETGIVIHTIGMGLSKGAPIPEYNKFRQKDYRTDNEGNVVISKLDENMLKKLAASGGGEYIRANNTKTGLNALFDKLNDLEKVEMDAKVYSEYEEQFQYFIGFGLLLLLIEFFIMFKKNKRLESISFFGKNLLDVNRK